MARERLAAALATFGHWLVAVAKWLNVRGSVAVVLIVGPLLVLMLWKDDPTPRDWPNGPPSLGVLVEAGTDRHVNVTGGYDVEDDRFSVEIGSCKGHDRVVVSFANVPFDIIRQASAEWRESSDTTPAADAVITDTTITVEAVEWRDGQSAVLLTASAEGAGCNVFALSLTGMDLSSSRRGRTLVETPTVRGCGAPAQGKPADDGTMALDGIDGRWVSECTEGAPKKHPVSIEAEPGQWVVKAEPPPPDPQRPYVFAGHAAVVLAKDGADRGREVRDELLYVAIGLGAAEMIEFIRRKFSKAG